MSRESKYSAVSVLSAVLIIVVWYLASIRLGMPIILPSPVEVVKDFVSLFSQKQFVMDICATVIRALRSFVIIVFSGAFFGILAGLMPWLKAFLKPVVTVFKATPVMSIILLAFIWFKTGTVPVFSAFLMAFPVMYVQTLQGVIHLDKKLDQMCRIYEISGFRKLKYFTVPALIPSLVTGSKQSLSMIWKVVIASEVITIPSAGVGRSLQMAQIQLQTSYVFAWTIVAIILTALGDMIFSILIRRCLKYED